MNIPENPSMGYIAIILFLIGLFLFVSGLNIIKIEKITVSKGFKTWVIGLLLMVAGVFTGIPELTKNINTQEKNSSKEKNSDKGKTSHIASEKLMIFPTKLDSLKKLKPIKIIKLKKSEIEEAGYDISTNDIIKLSKYGNIWTEKESYDVTGNRTIRVSVDVKTINSGITVAFSRNKKGWHSQEQKPDALSFYTGAFDDSFLTIVRTNMYQDELSSTKRSVIQNKWQKIDVLLTKNSLTGFIDGKKVIFSKLKKTIFPKRGFVGIAKYDDSTTYFNNFKVYHYE